MGGEKPLLILCERDVGLFSLIQQVIGHIPLALSEGRLPIVYFGPQCCYWTAEGYRGKDTVWEYYFQPLVTGYDTAWLAQDIKDRIRSHFQPGSQTNRSRLVQKLRDPARVVYSAVKKPGFVLKPDIYVSNHFGNHWRLKRKVLPIPFRWRDPAPRLRYKTSAIIRDYIRPRDYIREQAMDFYHKHMHNFRVIGLHVRGTDSISTAEGRLFRRHSLVLSSYRQKLAEELKRTPNARIFVATDDENSLNYIRDAFGDRVLARNSLRHRQGNPAGRGPTGGLLPGYISHDPRLAARNGEEALVEWLLLCRCDLLIHNGASLARTALLANPDLAHVNTHPRLAGLLFPSRYAKP